MRFGLLIAAVAATAVLATPALSETVTKRTHHGTRTVVTSRDESGHTRTRIIVEKRSFLDPGTEVYNGERRYNDGPWLVEHRQFDGPDRYTATDRYYPLPGRFELAFPSNPIGGQ
ncbi:MAG: hypothetical protein OJF62_001723 [Pseudolabrys sp.]|jgi:hypothetical protein|nr:hypothetical protein [Pseudolabrys sp.]